VTAFFTILPFGFRRLFLLLGLGMLLFSFLWELKLHLKRGRFAVFFGLLHSFIIYYGIPGKKWRMKRPYSGFIREGSLAFDIGSHIGNRIVPWLELGARVIAVEPNPVCVSILRFLHGRRDGLELVPVAVGSRSGTAVLYTDPANPTLSTISEKGIREDTTEMITLDQLIERSTVLLFLRTLEENDFAGDVYARLEG
jgi:FkbM family methyltransferase